MSFALAEAYVQLSQRGASAVGAAIDGVRGGLSRMGASASTAGNAVTAAFSRISGSLNRLLSPMGLLSSGLAAIGAGAGVGGMLKLAADAESTAVTFEVLLGSLDKARAMMAAINKFAAATPYEQAELAGVAKQLLAFGVAQENIIPIMTRLGDVASLSGAKLDDLARIYGKVKQTQKLQTESLMQFAERGIPVVDTLAKAYGKQTAEIWKLAEQGQLGFGQLEWALQSLTGAGGKFAGGMERQSKTLGGLWSTVAGDAKTELAKLGQVLADAVDLKGLLGKLDTFITGFLPRLGDQVATALSDIQPIVNSVTESIQEGFAIAWEWIEGIIAQFTEWFAGHADTWQTLNNMVTSRAVATWDMVRAGFDLVIALAEKMVVGWMAIGDAIAVVMKSDVVQWFWDITNAGIRFVTDVVKALTVLIQNWDIGWQLIWEHTRLSISNMWERLKTWFINAGKLLKWLWNNWTDVLRTIGDATGTMFQNMLTNMRKAWNAFWKWLKGGGAWREVTDALTKDLLSGFRSSIKEMPNLTRANVQTSNEAIDRLEQLLATRQTDAAQARAERTERRAAQRAAASAARTGSSGATSTGGKTSAGAGPGAPPPLAAGKTGKEPREKGFEFVGLAALAEKMQTEASKQIDQMRQIQAAERAARANEALVGDARGQGLAVRIVGNQPFAQPVPRWN